MPVGALRGSAGAGARRRALAASVGARLGSSAFAFVLVARRERLRRLAAVAVERDRLEAEPPALLVDLLRRRRPWPRSAGSRSCEMAPERNGCAAAIIRTCDIGARKRVPVLPQRLAQSNTA